MGIGGKGHEIELFDQRVHVFNRTPNFSHSLTYLAIGHAVSVGLRPRIPDAALSTASREVAPHRIRTMHLRRRHHLPALRSAEIQQSFNCTLNTFIANKRAIATCNQSSFTYLYHIPIYYVLYCIIN